MLSGTTYLQSPEVSASRWITTWLKGILEALHNNHRLFHVRQMYGTQQILQFFATKKEWISFHEILVV